MESFAITLLRCIPGAVLTGTATFFFSLAFFTLLEPDVALWALAQAYGSVQSPKCILSSALPRSQTSRAHPRRAKRRQYGKSNQPHLADHNNSLSSDSGDDTLYDDTL